MIVTRYGVLLSLSELRAIICVIESSHLNGDRLGHFDNRQGTFVVQPNQLQVSGPVRCTSCGRRLQMQWRATPQGWISNNSCVCGANSV